MYTDNITFAGYNITGQKFGMPWNVSASISGQYASRSDITETSALLTAVVDTVSSELLSKDVSGLMGRSATSK